MQRNLLVLTFSTTATNEMVSRLKNRIVTGQNFDSIQIKTFHGFCYFIIKKNFSELGFSSSPTVCSNKVCKEILKVCQST